QRPATVFTAASANSLRSGIVRLSDSALWCGQEIAGAPVRTWKSSSFSNVGRSREKSSLSGVTGLCITPRNLFCISFFSRPHGEEHSRSECVSNHGLGAQAAPHRPHASRACPTCALNNADLGQARDRCPSRRARFARAPQDEGGEDSAHRAAC